MSSINVTIWNEFRHEKMDEAVQKVYPDGIHHVIADFLTQQDELNVRTATLDEPEHGLGGGVLESTDVMIWWGHMAHHEVCDEIVEKIHRRVLAGMGLIVLHSGHFSKIFRRLMGTNCSLKWREVGERERLWNLEPSHPITQGIGDYFELPNAEMYGERFDIPTPDKLLFVSWFEGGEVFRSGCVWERGHGRVFYFRPGHETYPVFYNADVRRIIINAACWCAPRVRIDDDCPNTNPIEKIQPREIDYNSMQNAD